MSRFFFLVDSTGNKQRIDSLFRFGRATIGYRNITERISRTHFEIEPLSNNNQYCARLTLRGRYIRITSNSIHTEYKQIGKKIFIQHQDKIDLVSKDHPQEQFSFTVLDSNQLNTNNNNNHNKNNNNNPRKRKRELMESTNDRNSNEESLYTIPHRKRPKYWHNKDDSMAFDYGQANRNNLIHSALTPSPKRDYHHNLNQNVNSLSLSGLFTSSSSPSSSIANSPNKSNESHIKYGQLPSNDIEDNSQIIMDEEKHIMVDSEDQDIDKWLDEGDTNKEKQKEDVDQDEDVNMMEEKEKEKETQRFQRELDKLGRYSVAIPVIDCDRYKFDVDRVLNIIAKVLKRFMTIHRYV